LFTHVGGNEEVRTRQATVAKWTNNVLCQNRRSQIFLHCAMRGSVELIFRREQERQEASRDASRFKISVSEENDKKC
jgi:hypothetical protein